MSRRNFALVTFVLGAVTTSICLQLFQSPWAVLFPAAVAEEEVLINDDSERQRSSLDLIDDTTGGKISDDQSAPVFNLQLDPNDPRRQMFLELARKKAQLLSPEELDREIQRMQVELTELEATKKLRSIERELEILIEQFPQSRAARRAGRMLQTRSLRDENEERLESPFRSPDPNRDVRGMPGRPTPREGLVPTPDPGRRRSPVDDDRDS